MKRTFSVLILVVALAVGVCLPAAAQRTDATIRGTVTDETGGIIPGVPVDVVGVEEGGMIQHRGVGGENKEGNLT